METYFDVGVGALELLLVELLGGLLVGGVLKVGSEESEMLLLLRSVLSLGRVKLGIFLLNSLLDQTGVADADVVIGAARDLLAKILQPLSRSSQLAHLLDLKSFGLFAHILQEDCQVGGNSVWALQVLNIVTSVELLTKVFAHSLNVDNCIWELYIWLASVLETDRAQDLELLVLPLGVFFFLLFFNIN